MADETMPKGDEVEGHGWGSSLEDPDENKLEAQDDEPDVEGHGFNKMENKLENKMENKME